MKKKYLEFIFIVLFISACLIPSAGMLIWGESQAAANEILSSKPDITDRNGKLNTNVLADTTDYIADRFAFRQEMVTAWSWINAKLFSSSVEEKVVLGQDGWLFYGDTLDDYIGKGLSDSEIAYAARNLYLMQEYVEAHSGQMIFTIAPNKNSLYPQYMPQNIAQAGNDSNAKRLSEQIKILGVNYADLFSAFDTDEILYFKTDSHWNSKGAALAADTILGSIGRKSNYFSSSFIEYTAHRGDLYEMLYPAGRYCESDPRPGDIFSFECQSDPNGGNAISIDTICSASSEKLLCWRDSFGISLYPYLAESFGAANFSRASRYDLRGVDGSEPITVIIELVERNIKNLFTNAPIFEAPARDIEMPEATGESVYLPCKPGAENLTQIFGEIKCQLTDPGTQIYLCTSETAYEACVVKGSDGEHLAVSAWLPSEDSDIKYLCTIKNGEAVCYPVEIN